jgi:signal transduction histidine kinase/ligand-binding sensor domain-containing protein
VARRALIPSIFLALPAWSIVAFALNPSLKITQYGHHAWTIRDGFFQSAIRSIAQTPDGYLWLGTELGLLRFDGVRAVPWQPPAGQSLPSNFVQTVLAARDGRLWIATAKGLASWKDGKLTRYPELAEAIRPLFEDREGTIWVGTFENRAGRLCSIRNGVIHCDGQDGSFGKGVYSIYEANGNLWASTDAGIWRWKPGPAKLFPLPPGGRTEESQGLNDEDGHLLFSQQGLWRIGDGKVEKYPTPPAFPIDPRNMFRDREGGLWVGTWMHGLTHLYHGKANQFSRIDGLSGNGVSALFQDRQGNIWIGTDGGLDRFVDLSVSTISTRQGLYDDSVRSLLAANDGSVWLSTRNGLNFWKKGTVTGYGKGSPPGDQPTTLFQDDRGRIWSPTLNGAGYFENARFVPVNSLPKGQVHAIAQDSDGNLLFSYDDALVQIDKNGHIERKPWSLMGLPGYASVLVSDPVQGGVWLAFFFDGGVARFKDGRVSDFFSAANGLGKGFVSDLQLDPDGVLWASTEGGLSRIKDGRIVTLTTANGLPCDIVHWMREDDEGFVWLNASCGLVRMARSELDAWVAHPKRKVETMTFGTAAGVQLYGLVIDGYCSRVIKTADGRIWFLSGIGVSILDPRHLVIDAVPPPVHIEQVTADGETYDATVGLHLPAQVRTVSIHYTALSLAAPEAVRFRYKLEGQDPDWREVVNERRAEYSNLRPRNYRFRVMASNNSGVWNEAGASLDFSVAPAYYQTGWFRLTIAAAVLVFLWVLYRYRLHQLGREFNTRMEERINERTRIARDFHDTLLQSFQGVLMKLDAVTNLNASKPAEAQKKLEAVVGDARQAVIDGRNAVQGLRSSTVTTNDLARSIGEVGDELAAQPVENCPAFSLSAGQSRDLPPLVRDEIFRIACEAMRNSFAHSQATRVETEVHYEPHQFRLLVRDNGKGIDPQILDTGGREGHHGLPGMRERAALVGGKLAIRSQRISGTGTGTGTEIELTIPASIAYGKRRPGLLSKIAGKGT